MTDSQGGDKSARTPPDPNDPDVLHYEKYPPGCEVRSFTLPDGKTLVAVIRVRLDKPPLPRQNGR